MTLAAAPLFSADYAEARTKFLAAAKARDAAVTSYLNPHAKGPKGEDLFIDVATWGPTNASRGLLVISGTHGVEGYAGSACQIGWLKSDRNTNWPADFRLVMIHALNPYGFAWNRRVTEENVDLNRNFVDHGLPYPTNDGYDHLKPAIAPDDLSPESLIQGSELFRDFAKEYGPFAMQEAVSKGQYKHADGMYYGGVREQWSAGIFRHVVHRELAACSNVAIVDFHTGLGSYGDAELIIEDAPETAAYERARAWWGEAVASTHSGDSLSAHVHGSVDSSVPRLLPHADITMITVEYGTRSTLEVFMALRADNWLHMRGNPLGPEAGAIKSQIRDAFFPDEDAWKDRIWQRGDEVLAQAVAGLTAS